MQTPPISLHLSDDFFRCIWGRLLKLDTFNGLYFKSLIWFATVVVCHALSNHSRFLGVSFMPALLLVNIHPFSARTRIGLCKHLVNALQKEELHTVIGALPINPSLPINTAINPSRTTGSCTPLLQPLSCPDISTIMG